MNSSRCVCKIIIVYFISIGRRGLRLTAALAFLLTFGLIQGFCADNSGAQSSVNPSSPLLNTNELAPSAVGPLLDLFVKKGFVTQEEANQVKAEAEAEQTNSHALSQNDLSKWKISDGVERIELFGDIRLRYEQRKATDPQNGTIVLDRERYAVRFGIRGTLSDDFYYGLRIETGSNPRSSWVTAGTSTTGVPYQGPYGKSTATLNVGQAYLGWKQGTWLNLTLGKMPNPIYTTPMVWSSSLNPEGAAEQFKYTVGEADLFATFGQFVYEDTSPNSSPSGYFGVGNQGYPGGGQPIFLLTFQGGVKYHLTKEVSLTVAPVLYYYSGRGAEVNSSFSSVTPGFSGVYVGQGAKNATGAASWSGYPSGAYDGFNANQTAINDLLILEIPVQLKFNVGQLAAQFFGDFAYNFEGQSRANAAYQAADSPAAGFPVNTYPGVQPIASSQTSQVKAYQFGFGIGSSNIVYTPMQGLVFGNTSARHAWEFRTYWQHVEQYSLDPNLLDTDFFEGVENLQGIYTAFAYGFSANVIGTVRYGYASRINDQLGTGGSGQDIPQMNPINNFNIFQVDMTVRF